MNKLLLYSKNVGSFTFAVILALILGFFYVSLMGMGYRAVILTYVGALFFLGLAIYVRELRSFLLFTCIFLVPMQFGYHFIHESLADLESQPFNSGIAVDAVDVVLLILYSQWFFALSQDKFRNHPVTIGGSLGKMLLIWILYVGLSSIFTATRLNYSGYEVFVLFKGFILFFYLVNNIKSRQDFRVILYGLFAGTVFHALYICGQYVSGRNYTLHGEAVTYIGPEGFRSVGFFGSPDAASALISVIFPVMLACFLVMKPRPIRTAAIGATLLSFVAILLTKVRAAEIAVMVSTVTLILLGYLRRRISGTQILKLFVIFSLLLVMAGPFIVTRFEKGTYGEDRLPLIYTSLNMIKDHLFFGVGANNYPFNIQAYLPPKLRTAWAYTVHNEYLLRISETGIIGAFLFYGLVILLMVKLFKESRSKDPWVFVASAGLFAAILGSFPHRMFSFYHYLNLFIQFTVVLALCYIMERLEGDEQNHGNLPSGRRSD